MIDDLYEFEHAMIQERVRAGLREPGKGGRLVGLR